MWQRRCASIAQFGLSLMVFGCSPSSAAPDDVPNSSGAGGIEGDASAGAGAEPGMIEQASGGQGTGGVPAAAGSEGMSAIGGMNATGGTITGGAAGSAATGAVVDSGSGQEQTKPCNGADILCEDFESLPVGIKPIGGPWLESECFDNSVLLEVDDAVSHSGGRSLVSRALPYGACMLHAALGPQQDFWVRAWIYWDAGSLFTEHEVTAFELTPDPNVDDPGIRVGFRGDNSCNPTGVEINVTGGSEQTGCTGYQLAADTWYCFELHVVKEARGVTTDLFIDGEDQSYTIHGMAADVVANPDMGDPLHLRVGVRAYSGSYPAPVHIDDIAVSTRRIGCN